MQCLPKQCLTRSAGIRIQHGVGLIEILVAIIILAVGFLAAARMQVTGMRFSQSAYYESQAYFMAGDMIARMRANVAGVKAGAYDSLQTAASLTDPGCDSKMCSPAEIATQDLYDWSRHLHASAENTSFVALLPSSADVVARGQVSDLGNGLRSVTITWADDQDNVDATGTLRVDLITED